MISFPPPSPFILVSVNYQTPGLMMDLYNGWFQKNGGCGYVLKPAVMREEISYFSANTKDVLPDVTPQSLHVRVSILCLFVVGFFGFFFHFF